MSKKILAFSFSIVLLLSTLLSVTVLSGLADTTEQPVLPVGTYSVLDAEDVDASTNMLVKEDTANYYWTNAYFRRTPTGGWPLPNAFSVWGQAYTAMFSQNNWTSVDAGQSYIQYHVTPDSVLGIPLIIQKDAVTNWGGNDTAFAKFRVQVSTDGATYADLAADHIIHAEDVDVAQSTNYVLRTYSYLIDADVHFFRIYFPSQSEINDAATWNAGQACISTVMMIPAAAFDKSTWAGPVTQKVLPVGTYSVLDAEDVDPSTNMLIKEDASNYHWTNAYFRRVTNSGWPCTKTFPAFGKEYDAWMSLNNASGVTDGEAYIQYRVTPDSVLGVPYIIQKDAVANFGGADDAFGKFTVMVSEDGAEYTALAADHSYHADDAEYAQSHTNYVIRTCSYKIDANVNYIRIYFPKYAEIEAASTWNVGQAPLNTVMMLPVAAFAADTWNPPTDEPDEPEEPVQPVLPVGTYDTLNAEDVDTALNMLKWQDPTNYYWTNGHFFKTVTNTTWPFSKPFTVWDKTYTDVFSQNNITAVTDGEAYIQYHVTPDSVLGVPYIIQKDAVANFGGADAAFGKFTVMVSEDGAEYTALAADHSYHADDVDVAQVTNYVLRTYSYKIDANVNYIRIYFPKYAEIEAASTWNAGQAARSTVMMIPAAAFAADTWNPPADEPDEPEEPKQAILTPGTFDVPDSSDINSSSNMLNSAGDYYVVNGNFRAVVPSSWEWPYNNKAITVDKWGKTYDLIFSQNEHTGVEEGDAYVQYRVQGNSRIQIPLMVENTTIENFGGADKAFGAFTIMVSEDGELFKVINPKNLSLVAEQTVAPREVAFTLRIYGCNMAENIQYIRVYFPALSIIKEHAYNSGQVAVSVMTMLPAAAFEGDGSAAEEDFTNVQLPTALILNPRKVTIGSALTATYKGATAGSSWIGIFRDDLQVAAQTCTLVNGSVSFTTDDWAEGVYTARLYRGEGTGELLEEVGFEAAKPREALEQQVMTPGTFDSVSRDNYVLQDGVSNNGDCIIDDTTMPYMKSWGNVKGATTDNWVWTPDGRIVSWGREYYFVYTQYPVTGSATNRTSISYKVQKGTQLQVPVGVPSTVPEIFDDFTFEVSADGENWTAVADDNISYTSRVIDLTFDPEVRTYAVEIVEDGYFRLTFPEQSKMEEQTAHLNVGFLHQGGVFVVPAAAFASSYSAAIDVAPQQFVVTMEENTLRVLQEADKKLTLADVKAYLICQNCAVQFLKDGQAVGDDALVDSAMEMAVISQGSRYTEDGEEIARFALSVDTVDKIIRPIVSSSKDTVTVDDKAMTITGFYYLDERMSFNDLYSALKVENGEMKLVDADGLDFVDMGATVGNAKVYLHVYAKGCPDIPDGTLTGVYEIKSETAEKEIVFRSKNEKKVIIKELEKIVQIAEGMTVGEFLENIELQWASVIVYAAPDEDTFGFAEVTDPDTVIVAGMSMDLVVSDTTVYYEFELFTPSDSDDESNHGKNPNTGVGLPLAVMAVGGVGLTLAAVTSASKKKKK